MIIKVKIKKAKSDSFLASFVDFSFNNWVKHRGFCNALLGVFSTESWRFVAPAKSRLCVTELEIAGDERRADF